MPRKPSPRRRGQEANLRALFRTYKRGARNRKLEFNLSLERFRSLTKQPCIICGIKPAKRYRHSLKLTSYKHAYVYNGIDRVNNKKGYIDGNVAPCCWRCNLAKADLSLQDFLLYLYRAYTHAILPVIQGVIEHE